MRFAESHIVITIFFAYRRRSCMNFGPSGPSFQARELIQPRRPRSPCSEPATFAADEKLRHRHPRGPRRSNGQAKLDPPPNRSTSPSGPPLM